VKFKEAKEMSNIVVVYKSKYGSTEKYAKWIAEALSADIFKSNKIKPDMLENYSTIVY
jgi:flavodoxin